MSALGEPLATTATDAEKNPKPNLNHKNYLNLAAYVVNITLVYGIGNAGWLGPDNGEISRKYQTIITPNSTAFAAIWALIYLSQGVFSVVQFLPRFRAKPMLQSGLSYWYIAVTAVSIGWTLAFVYDVITLSLVFMILIWISLIAILYRQYYTKSDGSILEFWILRFPFAIHAGWITAASALNVNIQVIYMNQPADILLAVAIVSLAVLHAVSVWVLYKIARPNWTIACVLSWAFGWIYVELKSPIDSVTNTFAQQTIGGVGYAAITVCFIIIFQIIVRLGLLARPEWNPYKKVDAEVCAEEIAPVVGSDEDV